MTAGPDCRIEEATFTFIDVETTGLSPRRGARVCEVAAVSYRDGVKVAELAELVNPGVPIPPDCTAVHGITDAMVKDKPLFAALAPRLLAMLENTVIVAHNAPFDIAFITHELEKVGMKFPHALTLDTLRLARKNFEFESNKLGEIVRALNLPVTNWHRALADVEMTQKVFSRFLEKFRQDGAALVGDLKQKEGKHG